MRWKNIIHKEKLPCSLSCKVVRVCVFFVEELPWWLSGGCSGACHRARLLFPPPLPSRLRCIHTRSAPIRSNEHIVQRSRNYVYRYQKYPAIRINDLYPNQHHISSDECERIDDRITKINYAEEHPVRSRRCGMKVFFHSIAILLPDSVCIGFGLNNIVSIAATKKARYYLDIIFRKMDRMTFAIFL